MLVIYVYGSYHVSDLGNGLALFRLHWLRMCNTWFNNIYKCINTSRFKNNISNESSGHYTKQSTQTPQQPQRILIYNANFN